MDESTPKGACSILKTLYHVGEAASGLCGFYAKNRHDPSTMEQVRILSYEIDKISFSQISGEIEKADDPLLEAAYADALTQVRKFVRLTGNDDLAGKMPDLHSWRPKADAATMAVLNSSRNYLKAESVMDLFMGMKNIAELDGTIPPRSLLPVHFIMIQEALDMEQATQHPVLDAIKGETKASLARYFDKFQFAGRHTQKERKGTFFETPDQDAHS